MKRVANGEPRFSQPILSVLIICRGRPRACLELLLSFQRIKPEAFLDNVEIAVFMEQGKVVFDAYCGYDAVNGFPYSLAVFPALSVDFCRLKIGFNTLRFVNWKFEKIILHSFEIFIRTTSYKEIPAQDSDRAIQWLQAQIAMAKPKIRRKALDK